MVAARAEETPAATHALVGGASDPREGERVVDKRWLGESSASRVFLGDSGWVSATRFSFVFPCPTSSCSRSALSQDKIIESTSHPTFVSTLRSPSGA